jgi:hypothetical protein
MSFIVSMIKYVILGGLFITLVAGIIGLLFLFSGDLPIAPEAKLTVAAGGIAMFLLMVLSFGGVAIMISLHDRHREIVDGVHRIADALEAEALKGGKA